MNGVGCWEILLAFIRSWFLLGEFMPATSYSHLCDRMGLAPRVRRSTWPTLSTAACACLWPRIWQDPEGWAPHQNSVNYIGLITQGQIFGSPQVTSWTHRLSPGKVLPLHGGLGVVFSVAVGRLKHNRLELCSILLALRCRVSHLAEVDCRFIHLTDSYVSMIAISKGCSSSAMLMSIIEEGRSLSIGFLAAAGSGSRGKYGECRDHPKDASSLLSCCVQGFCSHWKVSNRWRHGWCSCWLGWNHVSFWGSTQYRAWLTGLRASLFLARYKAKATLELEAFQHLA